MLCVLIRIASMRQFNENTQHTFMLEKLRKAIPIMSPVLTLTSSNYPSLEHVFMVQKVFEPLKSTEYNRSITDDKTYHLHGTPVCTSALAQTLEHQHATGQV